MKTTILTLSAALILTAGIATAKTATIVKQQNVTVLTEVKAINAIEVHGNVELFISDGTTDQVKVYNKYYSESALVQNVNGVLRISSYNTEKLTVWVTAADLHSVLAYDNAVVKSFGSLSKIELNVDLHNNATANLDLDSFAANVNVNDFAKVKLSGTVNNATLKYSHIENIDDSALMTAQALKVCTTGTPAKINSNEIDEIAVL